MFNFLSFGKSKKDTRVGYGGMSADEISTVGKQALTPNALTLSGQRWSNAQRFAPFFYRGIQFFCVVIVVCMIIIVGSVLFRPHPLLLVSFPNGTVRCAGQNINMQKQTLFNRSQSQQNICDMLETRWSTPLTVKSTAKKEESDPAAATTSQPSTTQPVQAQTTPAGQ